MTLLEAIATLEAAVLECKKRDINTPEVREALDLLERYVWPKWLIPQFRHNIGGEREKDYQREAEQQVLRATFPGIRDSVRELLGVRADALARKFHETHDINVKDELERACSRSMASSRSRGSLGHSPKRDLDGAETGLDPESIVAVHSPLTLFSAT